MLRTSIRESNRYFLGLSPIPYYSIGLIQFLRVNFVSPFQFQLHLFEITEVEELQIFLKRYIYLVSIRDDSILASALTAGRKEKVSPFAKSYRIDIPENNFRKIVFVGWVPFQKFVYRSLATPKLSDRNTSMV